MKEGESFKNLKSRAKLKKIKDQEESEEEASANTGAFPDEPASPGKKSGATAASKMKKRRKHDASLGGSLS